MLEQMSEPNPAYAPAEPKFHALLTSDAARILNISADAVRRLERLGQLTAMRTAGGTRLFDRTEVERLARERTLQRAAMGRPSVTPRRTASVNAAIGEEPLAGQPPRGHDAK